MYQDSCGHHMWWHVVFMCALLTLLLVPSVSSQAADLNRPLNATLQASTDDVAAAAMPTTTGVPLANNTKNCGNTQKMVDNCFRDLPPHLMEFLQTSKIAINEQDITSKCNVFRRGMKCFDEYMARCIQPNNINILNNNVAGARRFFKKFCDDTTFQNHYLAHKECFTYIHEDWLHCNKQFQNILSEGIHSSTNVTNKFMEFCCARYAYETCIFNSARYKCYTNSASFARDTAKMLSDEKHFSNCRQYEESMCGRAADKALHHWTLWLALVLWLMSMSTTTMMPSRWRLTTTTTTRTD